MTTERERIAEALERVLECAGSFDDHVLPEQLNHDAHLLRTALLRRSEPVGDKESEQEQYFRESYNDLAAAIEQHLERFIIEDDVAEVAILLEAIEAAGKALVEPAVRCPFCRFTLTPEAEAFLKGYLQAKIDGVPFPVPTEKPVRPTPAECAAMVRAAIEIGNTTNVSPGEALCMMDRAWNKLASNHPVEPV